VPKHHTYHEDVWGSEGIASHSSALDGDEWSASSLEKKPPGNHFIGGWVGPTAYLDVVAKRKILLLLGIKSQLSSPYSVILLTELS
jgi:hypothetical protein